MDAAKIRRHNELQLRYYKKQIRATMVPADTPYNRRQVDELAAAIALQPGERVLEIGCGAGRHAFHLAQNGVQIEGLELTPELVDQMKTYDNDRYNIPVYCADVIDFPPQLTGRFDAVIGFFTLHHMHDLDRVFAAIAQMVKPGGRIAFVEPNPYNPLYYLQYTFTPSISWKAEKGTLRMRQSVLFGAMSAAGFSSLSMERFGFFPAFIARRPWADKLGGLLERFVPWKKMLPFQLVSGRMVPGDVEMRPIHGRTAWNADSKRTERTAHGQHILPSGTQTAMAQETGRPRARSSPIPV